jgi:hypothetical protein
VDEGELVAFENQGAKEGEITREGGEGLPDVWKRSKGWKEGSAFLTRKGREARARAGLPSSNPPLEKLQLMAISLSRHSPLPCANPSRAWATRPAKRACKPTDLMVSMKKLIDVVQGVIFSKIVSALVRTRRRGHQR